MSKISSIGPIHFKFTRYRSFYEEALKKKLEDFYEQDDELKEQLLTSFTLKLTDKDWNTLKHRYLKGRARVFSNFKDFGKPVRSGSSKGNSNKSSPTSGSKGGAKPSRSKFINHFVRAWRKRYQFYIQQYTAANPDWRTRRWYKWKKKAKKFGGKAAYNDKKIKYSTPALATGFLRQSIESAFRSGGTEYLSISNPMVSRWVTTNKHFDLDYNYDGYKGRNSQDGYPIFFESRLKDIGVVEKKSSKNFKKDSIVSIEDDDWEEMAEIMIDMYKKMFESGAVEDVMEIFAIYDIYDL